MVSQDMARLSCYHHLRVMARRRRGFVCGAERVEHRQEGEGPLSNKLTDACIYFSIYSAQSRIWESIVLRKYAVLIKLAAHIRERQLRS